MRNVQDDATNGHTQLSVLGIVPYSFASLAPPSQALVLIHHMMYFMTPPKIFDIMPFFGGETIVSISLRICGSSERNEMT